MKDINISSSSLSMARTCSTTLTTSWSHLRATRPTWTTHHAWRRHTRWHTPTSHHLLHHLLHATSTSSSSSLCFYASHFFHHIHEIVHTTKLLNQARINSLTHLLHHLFRVSCHLLKIICNI